MHDMRSKFTKSLFGLDRFEARNSKSIKTNSLYLLILSNTSVLPWTFEVQVQFEILLSQCLDQLKHGVFFSKSPINSNSSIQIQPKILKSVWQHQQFSLYHDSLSRTPHQTIVFHLDYFFTDLDHLYHLFVSQYALCLYRWFILCAPVAINESLIN